MAISYKDAGVDIEKGNEAVGLMKKHVARTNTVGVLTDIGNFAGLFAINKDEYEEPVLVSGTDGVGTKLRIAMMMDKHDTIGVDAVAMCVNDIIVQGAKPLFFLDYLAVGALNPNKVADIVSGVADGCVQSGAALIGGETAEMPDFYGKDEYDIAGFAVGIVDKKKIVDGSRVKPGDFLMALPSSGVHSNGFSLVRKIVFDAAKLSLDDKIPELHKTLGEELLTPTRIYVKDVLSVIDKCDIKAMCHVTGGGLIENLPRVFSKKLDAVIDKKWIIPPVFKLLQRFGNVDDVEMYRVFNMGIGYIFVVNQSEVLKMKELLPDLFQIGYMAIGEGRTIIEGVNA